VPEKEQDHALDALRYLISRVDANRMARIRKGIPLVEAQPQTAAGAALPQPAAPPERKWLSIYNEQSWTRLE
jgi:hypothetical protein